MSRTKDVTRFSRIVIGRDVIKINEPTWAMKMIHLFSL